MQIVLGVNQVRSVPVFGLSELFFVPRSSF